jgi:glutathione S-transferase
MTYHLYGGVRSRAFRVLWALEELGLPYEHTAAAPRAPEVLALNPSGKVPVLVSDGVAITDSTAIITYLADKHAFLTYPPGSVERARQDGFTQMVLDEIDSTLWTASRHSFVLPPEHRVPDIKPSLKWEFAQNCARIAAGLDGPFLMGETFTIADIVFGHCLGWASGAKFEHGQPVLDAYLTRMRGRPAYRAALAKQT